MCRKHSTCAKLVAEVEGRQDKAAMISSGRLLPTSCCRLIKRQHLFAPQAGVPTATTSRFDRLKKTRVSLVHPDKRLQVNETATDAPPAGVPPATTEFLLRPAKRNKGITRSFPTKFCRLTKRQQIHRSRGLPTANRNNRVLVATGTEGTGGDLRRPFLSQQIAHINETVAVAPLGASTASTEFSFRPARPSLGFVAFSRCSPRASSSNLCFCLSAFNPLCTCLKLCGACF